MTLLQGIPYDTRMAMMEFQLRNFQVSNICNIMPVDCIAVYYLFNQTLTEGTKVTLTYELNRYTLKVLECKPSKGTVHGFTCIHMHVHNTFICK